MLLHQILEGMPGRPAYRLIDERPFECLALCVSELERPNLIFIDKEAYIPSIKPSVSMVLTTPALSESVHRTGAGVCIVDQPRSFFFQLHNFLANCSDYIRPPFPVEIGDGCRISPLSSIAGANVRIGSGVVVEEFVTIRENTVIGDNCIVRSGSCIGGQGFEFKRFHNEILSVAHLGGVMIGNNVEIQQNTAVDRAIYPWDDTVIGDHTKIDNLVHIAHAVKIGRCNMIVANSGIGGRTVVGDDCWIGFGATVINGITIGDRARVNMGAVVTKSVPPDGSVTGNFAIDHAQFIQNLKKSLLP